MLLFYQNQARPLTAGPVLNNSLSISFVQSSKNIDRPAEWLTTHGAL